MKKAVILGVLSLLLIKPAFAQTSSSDPCSDALVLDTYNNVTSEHLDWRLASEVDRDTYDKIAKDAGANGAIFGVPVGANYEDFKQKITLAKTTLQTSLTLDQARNVMWTGLDPQSQKNYSDCLDHQILNSDGLHLAIKFATDTDVTVVVSFHPVGANTPTTINPVWVGAENSSPPARGVTAGEQVIIIPRPKKSHTLAVIWNGLSDALIIEPLPKAPQPFPTLYFCRIGGAGNQDLATLGGGTLPNPFFIGTNISQCRQDTQAVGANYNFKIGLSANGPWGGMNQDLPSALLQLQGK